MASIDEFFRGTRYATVDIDPCDPYGKAVVQCLNRGARRALVVLPNASDEAAAVAGETFASLRDVPGPLDGVLLNIEGDPRRMLHEVQAAVEHNVPRIWIENRCEAADAVRHAREHGVEVVDNVCALMVLDPHHIHWFHRKVLDLLHKTPEVQEPVVNR